MVRVRPGPARPSAQHSDSHSETTAAARSGAEGKEMLRRGLVHIVDAQPHFCSARSDKTIIPVSEHFAFTVTSLTRSRPTGASARPACSFIFHLAHVPILTSDCYCFDFLSSARPAGGAPRRVDEWKDASGRGAGRKEHEIRSNRLSVSCRQA